MRIQEKLGEGGGEGGGGGGGGGGYRQEETKPLDVALTRWKQPFTYQVEATLHLPGGSNPSLTRWKQPFTSSPFVSLEEVTQFHT